MTKDTWIWLQIGFLGQAIFTARFLVQWLASERKGQVTVPVAFWWFSLVGGMVLLVYAVHREEPVFAVGQSMGVFIYIRNLMLTRDPASKPKKRRRKAKTAAHDGHADAPKPHIPMARIEGVAEGKSVVSE